MMMIIAPKDTGNEARVLKYYGYYFLEKYFFLTYFKSLIFLFH